MLPYESKEIRMSAKQMCKPKKCKYCSNHFYDRCWDHDWNEEWDKKLECETIHAHNCTHNFKCAACHEQYLSQETLNNHRCAKNYQCEVCRKRCKNVRDVNSGKHELKRSQYGIRYQHGKIVNCNKFFVRVTSSGLRKIAKKDDLQECSMETKEAKKKAEQEWFAKRALSKDSPGDECVDEDSSNEHESDESHDHSEAEDSSNECNPNEELLAEESDDDDWWQAMSTPGFAPHVARQILINLSQRYKKVNRIVYRNNEWVSSWVVERDYEQEKKDENDKKRKREESEDEST